MVIVRTYVLFGTTKVFRLKMFFLPCFVTGLFYYIFNNWAGRHKQYCDMKGQWNKNEWKGATHTCVCIHTHTHTHTRTHAHAHTHTHTYTRVQKHTCTNMHAHTRTHKYMQVHTRSRMCICKHALTRIHGAYCWLQAFQSVTSTCDHMLLCSFVMVLSPWNGSTMKYKCELTSEVPWGLM